MKIRVVRIHNLNSLRGEFTIDFTASPLADTGLFAITGDTGAGKTTILDAVTLALYGRTSRGHEGEVMSYGTGECLAEVDFSAGGKTYRARWATHRARKKPDGNLQPPQRDLSKLGADGEFALVTDKVRALDSSKLGKGAIEQACGLNYEQFIRSVMLAQGQFAAFLQAKEGDRSILLERITGTDIYTRLSKAAFQRHKLERERLEELLVELKHFDLLSPERERELRAELAAQERAGKAAQRTRKRLEKALQWFDELRAAELQLKNTALDVQRLEQEGEALKAQQQRLERHRQLLPLRADLQRYDDQQLTQQALNDTVLRLQVEERVLTATAAADRKVAEDAKAAAQAYTETWKQERAALDRVDKLDLQRTALRDPLRENRERAQALAAKLTAQQQAIRTLAQSLSRDEAQLAEDQTWLGEKQDYAGLSEDIVRIEQCEQELRTAIKQQLAADKELQQLGLKQRELQQRLTDNDQATARLENERARVRTAFDALLPQAIVADREEALDRLADRVEALRTRQRTAAERRRLEAAWRERRQAQATKEETRTRLRAEIARGDAERARQAAALNDAQQHFLVVDREYRREAARHGAQELRRTLNLDEPCPVCGSVQHPYAELARAESAEFDQLKETYDRERARLDRLMTAMDELLTAQERHSRNLADLNEALQLDEERTATALAALRALEPATPEPAQTVEALREQIEREQTNVQRARAYHRQIEAFGKELTELRVQREQLTAQQQVFRARAVQQTQLSESAAASFSSSEACLNALLQPYGRSFTLDGARALFAELKALAAEYQERNGRAAGLTISVAKDRRQAAQLRENQAELTEQHEQLDKRITEQNTQLTALDAERAALLTAPDTQPLREAGEAKLDALVRHATASAEQVAAGDRALAANAARLSGEQQRAAQLATTIAGLAASLTARLEGFGLSDTEGLRAALLDDAEEREVREAVEAFRKRETALRQRYSDAEESVNKLKTHPPADTDEQALRERLAQSEAAQEDAQKASGQLQQQLDDNERRKQRSGELGVQLQGQQAEVDRWAKLNELIGSGDGKRFRVYAQGLTLNRLVGLANRHLNQLSGRYRIRKQPGESLDLLIVDTYQADFERSSTTLSGGESFLVSLSLALGLSDLAGRNAKIETLFIDEGFGTLDQNTLDVALTTLENLQADGKTIGIISHVKELQERIGTQIKVKKGGSGFSKLEVVG